MVLDARPEIARQRAEDRVRRSRRIIGQPDYRRVAQAQLQERGLQLLRQLVDVQVELTRADAHDARVQDQVRIRQLLQLRGQGSLRSDGRAVDLQPAEFGLADRSRLDANLALAIALVEIDEQYLAGAVLVQRDRLRRARVRIRDPAGAALAEGMNVAQGEVVEAARCDLVGRDDDVVPIGLAGDRDRSVDHADMPRGLVLVAGDIEIPEWAVRRALRREDRAMYDDVARRDVDRRTFRRQDGHQVVVRCAPGETLEIVRAVDRRAVIRIVRPGQHDGPDPGPDEPLELGRDTLDRTARLDVAVEQVACDQKEIDLLRDRQIDRCDEGGELALSLRGGLLAEVVMAGAEVDVRGMDDP